MTRTQIYLPEDLHNNLRTVAKEEKTTISDLLREAAIHIIKKKRKKKIKYTLQDALAFFANPPKKYQLKLTGKQLIDLMEKDRDTDY